VFFSKLHHCMLPGPVKQIRRHGNSVQKLQAILRRPLVQSRAAPE